MREKIMRTIPIVGVSNIAVLLCVSVASIWAVTPDLWWKTAVTCIIIHFTLKGLERALE